MHAKVMLSWQHLYIYISFKNLSKSVKFSFNKVSWKEGQSNQIDTECARPKGLRAKDEL